MAIPGTGASTVIGDTVIVVEESRKSYLKRLPAVVELAEKRAVIQAQWAVSITAFVIAVALAVSGKVPATDTLSYRLLDELLPLVCIIIFLGLAIHLYRRGAGGNPKIRPPWGPLLLSSAAFWIWIGISIDVFVRPIDLSKPIVYAALWCAACAVACVVSGFVYLIGRLFRRSEPKEIN